VTAITERYHQWMKAIRDRDLGTIISIYADHATYMPSGKMKARGQEALRNIWNAYLQRKDFVAEYTPDIHVSQSGDMAYDIGHYKISMTKDEESITLSGKYVVVWELIGGTWKAVVDIDNDDGLLSQV